MKKTIVLMIILLLSALLITGCDIINSIVGKEEEHIHKGGSATCVAPAICEECGSVYGEIGEHVYIDADCENARQCALCSAIDGEALGHNYTAASCTDPATCQRCGAIGGEALGHSYNGFYSYNEDVHWIECAVCKNKKDEGEHMGGEISGNERAKCEICSADYGELPSVSIDWVIEAKTPAVGSSFCLANSRIKNWYDTFDFTKTDTDAHWLQEDIFMPEAPFFTWSVGEAAHYYKVYISSSEDFSAYQCYLTATPELYVEHLYTGNTYYWFVDAVYDGYTVRSEVFSFMTAATPRTVNIEGVSNSRDIGGYLTLDGKRIKQGLVYRSAKLDDITELGRYTLLNILGVKTDLDLRGDRNNYYKDATHPVTELNHVVVACPWYSTGGNHIWLDEYNKNEFAKAVKVFADPDNYPIIFHCSLGRDRTGTLAMVLEGLLGVDENTLMMEYELSVFSYWGTNGGTKYNNGLRNLIHDTYLYINNNYEGDTFSQKVEDFLLEIGVSREEIASIKSIMLEEVE